MIPPERRQQYAYCFTVERLGLRVPPLALVQQSQVVEARGDVGMPLRQRGAVDPERLIVERLRLRVPPLAPVQQGQVVEIDGDGGMPLRQCGAVDPERLIVQRLGAIVASGVTYIPPVVTLVIGVVAGCEAAD